MRSMPWVWTRSRVWLCIPVCWLLRFTTRGGLRFAAPIGKPNSDKEKYSRAERGCVAAVLARDIEQEKHEPRGGDDEPDIGAASHFFCSIAPYSLRMV